MKYELVKYDQARHALKEATKVDDVKKIKDAALALEIYARQTKNAEMEKWVSEIKLRANVRIGELSRELDKSKGGSNPKATLPNDGKSKTETLKAAGISTSQANRAEKLADHKEDVEEYINKKAKENKAVKITEAISAVNSKLREEENKANLTKKVAVLSNLYEGDFREKSNDLPDECAELIFTDPPYDRKSINLFGDAARIASRILKPGGSFISYCGHIQLPEVLNLCSQHLRYWWVIAGVHGGNPSQMNKYGIKVHWKPLIWFVKKTRGDVQKFVPDIMIGTKEKNMHAWQQAESEASFWIDNLVSKSGVVVDFFVGSGTTLAACEKLKRKWFGFEIDPVAVKTASKRINDAQI